MIINGQGWPSPDALAQLFNNILEFSCTGHVCLWTRHSKRCYRCLNVLYLQFNVYNCVIYVTLILVFLSSPKDFSLVSTIVQCRRYFEYFMAYCITLWCILLLFLSNWDVYLQAIAPELTFYNTSKDVKESPILSTKLLHAQLDAFSRLIFL